MTKTIYIAIGKTDLFYNSMGLCGNFTHSSINYLLQIQNVAQPSTNSSVTTYVNRLDITTGFLDRDPQCSEITKFILKITPTSEVSLDCL